MVAITLPLLAALAATPSQLGIVCARFKESLDPWAPVAASTYLYSKGGVPQMNDTVQHSSFRSYVALPNIGREGHTHLHHIVNNYDTLDDIMIFTQADPFDLIAPAVNTTEQMVQKAMTVAADDVTPFNDALFHDVADWGKIDWNSSAQKLWITANQIKSLQLAPYTPAQFWTMVVGGEHPPAIRAMHGGTFAVRRETIRKPEVGFFMERMWAPMFAEKYRLPSVQNP